MFLHYTTVFSLLYIPSTVSFSSSRIDDTRTELVDEVDNIRTRDYFTDDNSLDANEIYDNLIENERIDPIAKKFFDPSSMVNVFRSVHNPTEIGFQTPPTDIPYSPYRGNRFQSIRSMKSSSRPPHHSSTTPYPFTLQPYPPLFSFPTIYSPNQFNNITPHSKSINTLTTTVSPSTTESISWISPSPFYSPSSIQPTPPSAPLMIFPRMRVPIFSSTQSSLRSTRTKKLFWPVWKKNTIIWVRTPPTTPIPKSTTPRPLPPQPSPVFRTTPSPKPVHIQRNRGPTFNCRVLNPEIDGKASSSNDWSCKMLFPGIPKDHSCKCLYEVAGRDDNGCATGYVYTCSRNH